MPSEVSPRPLALSAPTEDAALSWRAAAPLWLRLRRAGDTLTPGFYPDGQTWTEGSPAEVALEASPLVGIEGSSADYGDRADRARAQFLGVGGGAALPAPWQAEDAGAHRVEVYDLLGRRVLTRELDEPTAGLADVPLRGR